jgi:hypothetical protein
VQLFANGKEETGPEILKMHFQSQDDKTGHVYYGEIKTDRNISDYTVRLIPDYDNVKAPLENNLILWQH